MRFRILVFLLLLAQSVLGESLQDGFYAVVRKEAVNGPAYALQQSQSRLGYDPTFLGDGEDPLNVVVDRTGFVPLSLKEAPSKRPDTTERTQFWLGVSLTDEAAQQFERFTRDNLGGTVAIVVGGKVVTMHGIKAVIKGGQIQISRCGDNGCQVLFRELKDNIEE